MKFTSKLSFYLSTAAGIALCGAAFAQTAPAPADNEIVVTGFRAALESAMNAKRESDLPMEAIASEDIGKMPDQNVAESLQRLPGIQIGRDASGEGTRVLIDGLRQNLTTLNGDVFLTGKEFYVSGESSGNGAGASSQYNSLEGVPSEEVGGIDVYKNPKASLTEGGLGGTVDLKLRDPLAAPMGLSLGGNFRVTNSTDAQGWTPDGTFVATYKVSKNLAFTGSVSYDKEKTLTHEMEAANRNPWAIVNSATSPYSGVLTAADTVGLPGGQYYLTPEAMYFSNINDDRAVLGGSFGATAKLSSSIKSSINWFYSHEDDVSTTYSDKVGFDLAQNNGIGAKIPGIDPTVPYSVDSNGIVQSGTFNMTGAESATLYQHSISEANNVQWATQYNDGGPLRADIDVAYARATSSYGADQADVEHGYYGAFSGATTTPTAPGCNNFGANCVTGSGNHGYTVTYANGGTSGVPTATFNSDVMTNPAYTLFKSNWAWANSSVEELKSLKLDVEYDPSFIKNADSTLTGGFRYGGRNVDETFGKYLINDAAGQHNQCCDGPGSGPWVFYMDPGYIAPMPFSTQAGNPSLAKTVNIKGVGNVVVKDPNTGGMTNPATYLNTIWNGASNMNGGTTNNSEAFFKDDLSSFRVNEKTYAGYMMADIGSGLNGFHANFGLRFVQTVLDINNGQAATVPTYYGTASWNGLDNNVIPVSTHREYSDVLPSLNFVLDVTDEQKIRFGAARVVAAQDLFSLGVGNNYGFTRETGGRVNATTGLKDGFKFNGGSSGNTELDPYRANQLDLSYENYFSKSGIVTVGTFYKQVDNFVETVNTPVHVNDGFINTDGSLGTTANVSQPQNAGKGQIFGIEIGGQYAFDDKIVPWLDGFGIAANYTRSGSVSTQPSSFSSEGPIPGVSKNAVNTTVYYEKNGLSARLSYSWKDFCLSDGVYGSTLGVVDQNGIAKVYQIFNAAYGQIDGQIGYDITKNFGVVFSVQNITNEVQHSYLQWPNDPITYDQSGRRFFLGGKFKY